MDVSLGGSTDGFAGSIKVLDGRSGRRLRRNPLSLARQLMIAPQSMREAPNEGADSAARSWSNDISNE